VPDARSPHRPDPRLSHEPPLPRDDCGSREVDSAARRGGTRGLRRDSSRV
jgi:hypothetical protein